MADAQLIQSPVTVARPRAVLHRLELPGDALLVLYFAVLTRQCLWWLTDNNFIAWIVAATIAAIGAWFYVSSKPLAERERVGAPFWVVVVLPLVFVYCLRVAFPDQSFDVLNYRLLHAERGLRGFLYLPGEFFPTPAPYNPAPDMVTGIFRHVLGYRLGTIANLLAMIWVACIADKLLKPFWPSAWLRAFGVLLAVLAEHLLFEINNYMADLLALPLLLEATYLTLRRADSENERRDIFCVALLLGMSVAFKLTNASSALPVVLLCAYRVLFKNRDKWKPRRLKELALTTMLCAVAFLAPLVSFSVWLYRETGSPVFPVFNGIFKSVYWHSSNVWDPRWGPSGLWEKLAWPILISFNPERLSEIAVYSGRISFGFAVALVGFVFFRRDARLRVLCFIVVAGSVLWSASTGYIRYALYLEVMAAVFILAFVGWLARRRSQPGIHSGLVVACLLGLGLVFQSGLASYYTSKHEWSGRETFIRAPRRHASEARYLFRDRTLRDFLKPETLEKFDRVEVWIMSSMKTSSLEVMLQPQAPMLGIDTGEFFMTNQARARFNQALERQSGKRMFSLAFAEDMASARETLRERGLVARDAVAVEIPFFSRQVLMKAFLIEVARAAPVGSGHDPAYHAELSAATQPGIMTVGEKQVLELTAKNAGNTVWRSRVPQGWMNIVTAGNRWLTADGAGVVNDLDSRTALPHDLKPGDEAKLLLTVTAPQAPGEYVLEIDMVHEGVTWFHQRGSRTLRWPVKVVKTGE